MNQISRIGSTHFLEARTLETQIAQQEDDVLAKSKAVTTDVSPEHEETDLYKETSLIGEEDFLVQLRARRNVFTKILGGIANVLGIGGGGQKGGGGGGGARGGFRVIDRGGARGLTFSIGETARDKIRRQREENERAEKKRVERERKEQTARAQREQAERARREQVERVQREQIERAQREQAERARREQAERVQREQVERAQKEQAERAQREQIEREAKEKVEREEAARLTQIFKEQAEREAKEQENRLADKAKLNAIERFKAKAAVENWPADAVEYGIEAIKVIS